MPLTPAGQHTIRGIFTGMQQTCTADRAGQCAHAKVIACIWALNCLMLLQQFATELGRSTVPVTLSVRTAVQTCEQACMRDLRLASMPNTSEPVFLSLCGDYDRGRRAVSGYKMLQPLAGGTAALVEWQLQTGRTHQIR